MSLLQAIILAIIEGLTEFLPVSSTGHMIIGSSLMGIAQDPFVKVFTVVIQFGAILSVVALYWRRFFQNIKFYLRLIVAFLPAAVFGLLFKEYIDSLLENILVVAIALVAGGVVFLLLDGYFARRAQLETSIEDITYPKALRIGFFQVISMIPGVSRSAATIIGGLTQGLSPTTAAEFSFFLAVPTMFAATCKSLWDYVDEEGGTFTGDQLMLLGVGNLAAFIVAFIAIRTFMQLLHKHGLKVFGYYRIVLGLLIILLWYMGYFRNVDIGNF